MSVINEIILQILVPFDTLTVLLSVAPQPSKYSNGLHTCTHIMLIYVQKAHVYTHVCIYAWVSFEAPRNSKAFFGYPIKKLTELDLNMTNTITRNEIRLDLIGWEVGVEFWSRGFKISN